MAAKKKAAESVAPEIVHGTELGGTEIVLTSKPSTLISMIDDGLAALIPTRRLAPFFVQADFLKKRLEGLMKSVREVLITTERRNSEEATVAGDKNQHRVFEYDTPMGHAQLTIQEKRSWRPNPEKLEALLKRKKLWDLATDLRITTSGKDFQKFLRQHRAEIRLMGVEITEEVNSEKVDGLCLSKQITEEELEAILDKPDPTYALLPKLKK